MATVARRGAQEPQDFGRESGGNSGQSHNENLSMPTATVDGMNSNSGAQKSTKNVSSHREDHSVTPVAPRGASDGASFTVSVQFIAFV